MRPLLVLIHRWAGLLLACFLALAGATGCVLAWYHELDAAISPRMLEVGHRPGAAMLDPLRLREAVERRHPEARVNYIDLYVQPGESLRVRLSARPGAASAPENDEIYLDPYTGEELGGRRWGDLGQGAKNLMPFLYRLHHSLALDKTGTLLMGIVGLIWTLDCLVGLWLTFPARQRRTVDAGRRSGKGWWARWWISWKIRRGGAYKLQFDLHRAGGLWLWAMLLVIAWSSVAVNLREVYNPVMRAAFEMQPPPAAPKPAAPKLAVPQPEPGLSWDAARDTGRRLMAAEARAASFAVLREQSLTYDPAKALFRYRAKSDRDVNERWGQASVWFDANTGERRGAFVPTGKAGGDTVSTWIIALHMAALWGWPFKLLMSLVGLGVVLLSVTGVLVWRRKRQGRTRPKAGGAATV